MRALALSLLMISAPATALDNCYTGSWYDPATDGEGITLEVSEDLVTGYFYTWKNGTRDMYTLTGYNSDFPYTGLTLHASFLQDGEHQTFPVGNAAVEVQDANTIYLGWEIEVDWETGLECIANCTSVQSLVRLTKPVECE